MDVFAVESSSPRQAGLGNDGRDRNRGRNDEGFQRQLSLTVQQDSWWHACLFVCLLLLPIPGVMKADRMFCSHLHVSPA